MSAEPTDLTISIKEYVDRVSEMEHRYFERVVGEHQYRVSLALEAQEKAYEKVSAAKTQLLTVVTIALMVGVPICTGIGALLFYLLTSHK